MMAKMEAPEQAVMVYLTRRIWLALVVLLTILIAIVTNEPVASPPPTVICSTWYVTREQAIRIVDYLCDTVLLPDFARYVIYQCPTSTVSWLNKEDAGVKVDLSQCTIEEPGWR